MSDLKEPLLQEDIPPPIPHKIPSIQDKIPPILVADSSKEMKRSTRTSLHLLMSEESKSLIKRQMSEESKCDMERRRRLLERHSSSAHSCSVRHLNEGEQHLENREKRNKWVKEKISRAFRQEKSPLTHYVYMRHRLYVARLCFALASATLFVSQNVLQFAKSNGGMVGERAYEVSVLLGSAFGALYYGLRLDRKGWFTTTLHAASFLTAGTFLSLAFRIGLSATYWGISDTMFDVIYSTCLCIAGVLTGFGV